MAADNDSQGWIKLHRQLLDNPIVQKPIYCHLWITLLLKAAHIGTSFVWNGEKQVIRPGQVLTGRDKLSKATGIKPSTVERILKYLENEQQIGQQKTQKFRIITIKNWEKYQFDKKLDSKVDNRRTTDGHIQECKEGKEHHTHWLFQRFWNAYPRKIGKGAARTAFGKFKPDDELLAQMLIAIEQQCMSEQWRKDRGQYIPHPATWLNQERWTDKMPEPKRGDPDWLPDEEEAEAIMKEVGL